MAISNAERQKRRRERITAAGGRRITVIISKQSNERLLKLAEKHSITHTKMIELGLLIAEKMSSDGDCDGTTDA